LKLFSLLHSPVFEMNEPLSLEKKAAESPAVWDPAWMRDPEKRENFVEIVTPREGPSNPAG
jgi:hypothetical protein